MPIYEYLCESCSRVSERMQKVTDPPLRTCPECGSRRVAKLVSRSAFQLKGGGWYADLYSSPRKDGGASGGGEASPPKPKPEAKAPSKPEAKVPRKGSKPPK